MEKQCPECREPIAIRATSCKCGWQARSTAESPTRRHVQCAHESCYDCAIVMQMTEHGFAKLCYRHYLAHHDAKAEAWAEARGLQFFEGDETRSEWRARLADWRKTHASSVKVMR